MIKETYVGNVKNLPIDCHREYVNNQTILAPSIELKRKAGVMKNEDGTKNPRWDFETYAKEFEQEIRMNERAMKRLHWLKEVGKHTDVYLICYCKNFEECHRKILLKILNEI